MSEQAPERRHFKRVPINVTVRIEYTGAEFPANSANLSKEQVDKPAYVEE